MTRHRAMEIGMNFEKLTLCVFLCLSVSGGLRAAEHRQQGVHEHGVAHLDLARQGKRVELHLESPAMNLVGFEHMPSDDADRRVLDKALATLRAGDRLFHFDLEAACRLVDATVKTPLTDSTDTAGHADVERDDDKHEKHEEQEDHAHGHHADIDADYRFACANPDALRRIRVELFREFPATQRLLIQFVTDSRQGAAELTAASPELAL